MLYWLLQNPKQKGAWISPIYRQAYKVFQELESASRKLITKSNKAELARYCINGSTLEFLGYEK